MILRADARHIPLADETVQCVVTSPPYWGLRDYGTARWEGGDADCDHSNARIKGRFDYPTSGKQLSNGGSDDSRYRDACPCGARRIDQQIGLERTPDEYVATMVGVFREIRRVLKKDGTVWLNLGDSYAANRSYQVADTKWREVGNSKPSAVPAGLKAKDLCGIPWRVAFALQADGWYPRSDIVWAKPNPMPESVTDRPTRSHEYIFLLAKNERYFYDADAVREPWADARNGDPGRAVSKYDGSEASGGRRYLNRFTAPGCSGRNKRDVWTVNSEPTPEAHFATFPQKLIEPCILAGSRIGDIVLDPFLGSGTVGRVCERFGRRWVGLELSAAYIRIAKRRSAQIGIFCSYQPVEHEPPVAEVGR